MSMELWQRLKDLEKKVQEQSDRLKALQIAVQQGPQQEVSPGVVESITGERLKARNEIGSDTAPAAAVSKHKPCPKCGKAPGYYFHVKYCTGNAAEVA
jgi:hypothetical protein